MITNLGRFRMNPRGSYSPSETYNTLDVVLYSGSSYVCKSDEVTTIPTNTTYWQLLASAGQATMTASDREAIIQQLVDDGVVIDGNYNTFTSAEKTKLDNLPDVVGEGILTIKKNGTTIGTFDQSTNLTLNISVPVSVSDLSDGINVKQQRAIESMDSIFEDRVKPNTIYYNFEDVKGLTIIELVDVDERRIEHDYTSDFYFYCSETFDIVLPSGVCYTSNRCNAGNYYNLHIFHKFCELKEFTISA